MKTIKLITLLALVMAVSSCDQELTYNYLVQHPNVLAKKIEECQSASNLNKAPSSQCKIVYYAATNFMSAQEEAAADPEKLGQKMIDIENEYATLLTNVNTAKTKLADLQNKKADDKDIQQARMDLDKLQSQTQEKLDEMKFLLAVIGRNSPE